MDRPDTDQIEHDFDAVPETVVVAIPEMDDEPEGGVVESDITGVTEPESTYSPIPEMPALEGEGWVDESGRIAPIQELVDAARMTVRFSAHIGKVLKTYYDSTHPDFGNARGIDVELSDLVYGTTPALTPKPPAESRLMPVAVAALPWPARADQAAYHVKVGEDVTVFFDDWGQAWFMSDDLPFVATVQQNPNDASTKEDNFGGAGHVTLKVKRQIMATDPDTAKPTFSDSAITYNYVRPLTATGQHHGYRKDDLVLCFRRGRYVYALPGRTTFHGKIVNTGPNSEVDFEDERYWVQILGTEITYGADDNSWIITTTTPLFTVCAANLAERHDGTHKLAVDGTVEIMASLLADASDATKSAYWIFSKEIVKIIEFGLVKTDPTDWTDITTITLRPCDKDGVEDTEAADVVVHIRDDQGAQDPTLREWVAAVEADPEADPPIEAVEATMLTWVRYAAPVDGVDGVLIGEGFTDTSELAPYHSSQYPGCYDLAYRWTKDRKLAGWYYWHSLSSTWIWHSPFGFPDPEEAPT